MEVENENKMGFMETELRLGLPGNNNEAKKRGFSETVDLKLNINEESDHQMEKKKNLLPRDHDQKINLFSAVDPAAKPPPPKAQVVGWPPVRSYRKNVMLGSSGEKKKSTDEIMSEMKGSAGGGGSFVKVSMDGAPYLRKVDLNMYNTYRQLSDALTNMFSSSYETNNVHLDYVPTYEDKDGDWMLVGDVPWEMFVQSCKRLRIMKGAEATGLAPRAMEKRKNKS